MRCTLESAKYSYYKNQAGLTLSLHRPVYARLMSYLKSVEESKGDFPLEYFDDYLSSSEGISVSSFNNRLTHLDEEVKKAFIREFLSEGVKVISKDDSIAIFSDLLHHSSRLETFSDSLRPFLKVSLDGSFSHKDAQFLSLLNIDSIVCSELPLWISKQGTMVRGHIDLVMVIGDSVYIIDYKPHTSHAINANPGESFINSVPQLAAYGILFKQKFKLKNVYCIAFNGDGAWIYEPYSALNKVTTFYKAQYKEDPAWCILL